MQPSHDREILLSRLMASRQWDRLLETSREWLADDPENGRAHRCAAQALVNLDRKPEAEKHLAKALFSNPNDTFAHRLMAIVQFDLKKYREADKSIHDAITLGPEDAQNWYQLAWMCYQQKDRRNGLKWAAKARELEPENPDILNLYALCAESSASGPGMLQEVLSLDPENAPAHNNLGVYYLDQEKDFAKAEEYFRRALTLQPMLKVARKNLFIAVKHRDPIYRALCAPRDFLFKIRHGLLGRSEKNFGAVILGVIFWLILFRFVIGGLILWFGLVWPLVKFYEFLVVGDLRKKVGEIGANRGGVFNYRRWSLRTRLALFAVGLIAFWTSIYLLFKAESGGADEVARVDLVGLLFGVVFCGLIIFYGIRFFKKTRLRYHSWRRDRVLRKFENPGI